MTGPPIGFAQGLAQGGTPDTAILARPPKMKLFSTSGHAGSEIVDISEKLKIFGGVLNGYPGNSGMWRSLEGRRKGLWGHIPTAARRLGYSPLGEERWRGRGAIIERIVDRLADYMEEMIAGTRVAEVPPFFK